LDLLHIQYLAQMFKFAVRKGTLGVWGLVPTETNLTSQLIGIFRWVSGIGHYMMSVGPG